MPTRKLILYYGLQRHKTHIAPECDAKPIRYVTLHFRDRRGEALLCYKNRTEFTVLMCEREPYLYGFHFGAKTIQDSVNIACLN